MNSRERRALRNYKADHKFDALAAPAPPPVEFDEEVFQRVDAAYEAAKSDGSITRWRDERALDAQMQRQGVAS